MVKVDIKKLWQNKFVSVRDIHLKLGMGKGGLEITYNKQSMVLDEESCANLYKINKDRPQNLIKSKFGKGSYFLVDIEFKPLTTDHRQQVLI